MKATIILAATAALLVTAATAQCPPGNWSLRSNSCYKWFPSPDYWLVAQQTCRSHQAHLVSIGSDNENTLVARLAQCTDAWIGRFGTNLNRLTDPSTYEWTDGSDAVSFHKHNFTGLDTVHKPLIRSDGEWWLNSLYHERHPFVCEVRANASTTARCPNGWTLFNNHCYLMPEFESNFNEANFYCQSKSSQLVSVLSESELSHINKLIFGIGACRNPLDTVWIGLIKLNPCFPDSGGRELCYQWTDFSGKHQGFPKWHAGHPNKDDWTVNCVTLTGDGLRSDKCHNRHRFVCKSAAGNDTGGVIGSVYDVVAAFDFRKGLDNLVNPRTYVVRDDFGVNRTKEDGACFTRGPYDLFYEHYKIGQPVLYEYSLLGLPKWTLFMKSLVRYSGDEYNRQSFVFTTLNQTGFYRTELSVSQKPVATDTSLYAEMFQMQNDTTTTRHRYSANINNTSCHGTWCDFAISLDNFRATFHVDEESAAPYRDSYKYGSQDLDELEMALGIQSPQENVNLARFCVRCFGIAHKQLDSQELRRAFATYCP